jgi:uncharacterized membrane protein
VHIFLTFLSFVLPVSYLILGWIFYHHPPKKINSIAGYRTTRSMQSQEAWDEAQTYSSKLMLRFSISFNIIVAISVLLAGKSDDKLASVATISVVLCLVFVFMAIANIEKHLKDMFGEK